MRTVGHQYDRSIERSQLPLAEEKSGKHVHVDIDELEREPEGPSTGTGLAPAWDRVMELRVPHGPIRE